MHDKIYKLLIFLFLFLLSSCSKVIVDDNEEQKIDGDDEFDYSEWYLVWEDDFNRDDIFSTGDWEKIKRVSPTPEWMTNISDYEDCFDITDGKVILRGLNNKYLSEDTAKFLTGGIWTKGSRSFRKGLIEVRAKFQAARSAWPAIWLLPVEGGWPEAGEIDIMERLHYDKFVIQTVHSHYIDNLGINNPSYQSKVLFNPETYNTFSVELGPDSLKFYVNNKPTLSYPRLDDEFAIKNKQYPFDRDFYLIIDMQLGASWMTPVNPHELPIEMEVDWVRFYQKR